MQSKNIVFLSYSYLLKLSWGILIILSLFGYNLEANEIKNKDVAPEKVKKIISDDVEILFQETKDFVHYFYSEIEYNLLISKESYAHRLNNLIVFIVKHLDVDEIIEFTLGKHWIVFSKQEKQLFTYYYKRILLMKIIKTFLDLPYDHVSNQIRGVEKIGVQDFMVYTFMTTGQDKISSTIGVTYYLRCYGSNHVNCKKPKDTHQLSTESLQKRGRYFKLLDILVGNISHALTERNRLDLIIKNLEGVKPFLSSLKENYNQQVRDNRELSDAINKVISAF